MQCTHIDAVPCEDATASLPSGGVPKAQRTFNTCAVILSAWQAKIAGVNRALRLQSA
jgi:hypothetical protein